MEPLFPSRRLPVLEEEAERPSRASDILQCLGLGVLGDHTWGQDHTWGRVLTPSNSQLDTEQLLQARQPSFRRSQPLKLD